MKIGNAIAAAILLTMLLASGCEKKVQPKIDLQKQRDFANALYNRQLYHQSIAEYNDILHNYDLQPSEAANLNYIIGDIYFERVRDYENALAYYLKVKHLYPDSPLLAEVSKKIVECLERLQRSADAQQALDESALIEPSEAKKSRPGEVIARIGKKSITTGDLEFEISQLPPYVKSQLNDKSSKIDFLKQYIATELLYDSAKRKGLEKDKEVIEATFQAKRNFMVQKLLQEEISQSVDVQESEVKLYYDANKENYAKKDDKGKVIELRPFEEVKAKVMQDYIRKKQQEAYDQLIQRLMRAEAVQIYDDKLQ
jgi:hypothetical protein